MIYLGKGIFPSKVLFWFSISIPSFFLFPGFLKRFWFFFFWRGEADHGSSQDFPRMESRGKKKNQLTGKNRDKKAEKEGMRRIFPDNSRAWARSIPECRNSSFFQRIPDFPAQIPRFSSFFPHFFLIYPGTNPRFGSGIALDPSLPNSRFFSFPVFPSSLPGKIQEETNIFTLKIFRNIRVFGVNIRVLG